MGRSRIAHAATIICTILIVGLSSYTGYANDKIIKVGIQQNPPLAYKDSDGTFKGLGVDVIEYIAAIEGWRLQYIHCSWSKCLEMLKSGETDLQIIIAYSKERAEKYDFTRETLFNNWGQVYIRPGSKIVSLLDLVGKKVSLVRKNIHAIAFKKLIHGLGINSKFIEVDYNKSAFKLVSEREADAAVTNRTWGELNAKGYGLEKTSIIFNPIEIRQAVLKDTNQDILNAIDRHLKALKENKGSIYHQSLANLFGSIVKKETPRWVKWSLASSAIIIILFALVVAILRYRVNQKTKEIIERKRMEEALRESEEFRSSLLENSPNSILVVEKDTSIKYVNPMFEELTGYTAAEIVGKKAPYPWWTEELKSGGVTEMEKEFLKGFGRIEQLFQKRNGAQFWVEIKSTPIKRDGEFKYALSNWVDITERKRADEKLKASLREKEMLLSEIHHRVKNNMQVITSLLRLQAGNIKEKKYAEMFKDSQSRIQSMALVHEQLYQTKDFTNVNFQDYIKSLVNSLFRFNGIDTNKIKAKIEIEDVSIPIDSAVPCALLVNELVSNVFKHAFPDERKGEVTIALRSINGDELELIVSDNGVGIPDDLNINNPGSFGMELISILAEDQLGGQIDIDRTGGTKYQIRFKKKMHRPRI